MGNRADVTAALGVAKLTVAGPLSWCHDCVTARPAGRSGSLTDPCKTAVSCGKVRVKAGPALTIGPVVLGAAGLTMTAVSAKAMNAPSLAVSRRTYAPGAMKRATVTGDDGVSKATAVGPLVSVQPMVSVRPGGKPGSTTEPTRVTLSTG